MPESQNAPPTAALSVEWWPIGRPKPYPANARKLSARAVETLALSLKQFGWRQPIVVDVKDVIVAGHTRLLAAQACQMTQVPVHVARELTAAQTRAYRIMDNRSADETEWDMPTLESELAELAALEVDLSTTGFDAAEIADLLKPDPLTDEDDVPPVPETPVTKLGDLWLLGGHRVLCGDATNEADLKALMAGAKADLIFTDPPYGVGYDGGTKRRDKLAGDATTDLYAPCCQMAATHATPTAALYLWHAGVKGIAAAAAAAAAGWSIRCEIIWNKNQAQFGALGAQYKHKHEPCYYCFRRGKTVAWYGPTNEVTVWDCNRQMVNEYHPTQKPVALAERAIGNSSKAGERVLDLFLGSGSTVLACEKTRRACVGLELAPAYVDVIVARWQAFTGQAATLEGDGRTFEAIAKARAKKAKAA